MSETESKMSFLEHLEELRKRLIRCLLAVFGGMIACWFFREEIRGFLEAPLYEAWSQVEGLPEPQPLNFTGLLDPFVAYLKMAAVGGIFVGSPVILYQLWKFVAPGLYAKERKIVLPFVLVSSLLFVGGSTMAYAVVFPIGFRFFLEFAVGQEVEGLNAEVTYEPGDHGERTSPDAGPSAAPGSSAVDAGPTTTRSADDAGPADGGVGDGGPDGGVRAALPPSVRRAGEPEPEPNATGPPVEPPADQQTPDEEEEPQSWFEYMLAKILERDCRSFEGTPQPRDGQVKLRFSWNTEKCGPAPEIVGLNRNDERLTPTWSELPDPPAGRAIWETVDHPPAGGTYSYEVRVTGGAGSGELAPVLMLKDYLSFAVRLILAFGLMFELPILITFLSMAGIVNYKQLIKFFRWFIVLAVVIGAMLTPPDVVTQLLLATPLVVLYLLSIGVAYIFGPKPDE